MLSKLNKTARTRAAYIRKAETGLLNKAESLQTKLENFIIKKFLPSMDVKNGQILNNSKNLKLINNSTKLRSFLRASVDAVMYEYYERQFKGINSRTDTYFNNFKPSSFLRKQIALKGGLMTEGVLDSLFDNNDILRALQGTLRAAIASTQEVSEVQTLLKQQINGREEKFGIIKSFHYSNGYDKLQSYSRTLDEGYSKALKLNYAIYAGGEIKTTRSFCDERNGNVYNRETIESWNALNWQGKIQDGNVLIDAGGYNCRHDYDWISYQLAKRINPNIEKSKYDK